MKEKNCFWYLEVFKNSSQKLFFIIGFLKCFKPVFDWLICSINLSHISCRLTRKLIWASSRDHTHSPCLRNKLWEREKKKRKKKGKKSFPMERVQFRMDHWKFKVACTRQLEENFISWLGIFVVVDFLVNFFLFVFSFFDDVYYCGLS